MPRLRIFFLQNVWLAAASKYRCINSPDFHSPNSSAINSFRPPRTGSEVNFCSFSALPTDYGTIFQINQCMLFKIAHSFRSFSVFSRGGMPLKILVGYFFARRHFHKTWVHTDSRTRKLRKWSLFHIFKVDFKLTILPLGWYFLEIVKPSTFKVTNRQLKVPLSFHVILTFRRQFAFKLTIFSGRKCQLEDLTTVSISDEVHRSPWGLMFCASGIIIP